MAERNIAKRGWTAAAIVAAILIIDQVIKIWVKTHMTLHEQIEILSWFRIVFIENNGMAYGMELGSKLVLSLFRVVAVGVLIYYMAGQVRNKARWGYVICLAMITAGAAGNIFDSMFYGLIFNGSSESYVSYFVPFGEGYASFLTGKVVDMFYFPLFSFTWPEWVPVVGGQPHVFFSPVFNFADAAISVGVVAMLLFYRKEIGEISIGKAVDKAVDKKSLPFILLLMMVGACKPSVPSEVIQPSDMEDILYDYHVAQAMANNVVDDRRDFRRNLYYQAVLKKYGISEAEFDSSLVYNYSHIDRLKDIYGRVNERLSDEARGLGASVGDIRHYSQYTATGDTANIWAGASDVLLIPRPTKNRYDFTVKADTTFRRGDTFMFQFMSEYIFQNGMRDAVVCIASHYEGDSIIQTVSHVSTPGIAQVRVPACYGLDLKELKGYIYLTTGGDDSDTRKMMFVSDIQLIRFHDKRLMNEAERKDTLATDSIQRAADSAGRTADDARRRDGAG